MICGGSAWYVVFLRGSFVMMMETTELANFDHLAFIGAVDLPRPRGLLSEAPSEFAS